MRSSTPIPAIFFCLVTSAAAQTSPKIFDNFDTTRGVTILIPRPIVPVGAKEAAKRRKNAQGKWVVVFDDKLVKKTAQTRQAAVTDGLATREMPRADYNKLIMATGSQLKGFTTG